MKNLLPLMHREWLQHRFAWTMLFLVPLALAALPLTLGTLEFDGDTQAMPGAEMALMVGLLSIVITPSVLFLLFWVTSMFIAVATPRRDHGDRSIEFWLSLPTGHAESVAAPMLVHLLLVPAAALVAGLLSGLAISLIVVGRYVGLAEWFALPWVAVLTAAASFVGRVLAGLPLATLWLLPLLLAAMLANAFFKRWGLPVLIVALSLGAAVLNFLFGQPILAQTLGRLGRNAGLALVGAGGQGMVISSDRSPLASVAEIPEWALRDLGAAFQAAVSPFFVGTLLVSALLFYGLVLWRQRGAGAGG